MEPTRGTQSCMRGMRDGILYRGYVRDAEHAAVMSANDVIWTRAQQSAQQWCQLRCGSGLDMLVGVLCGRKVFTLSQDLCRAPPLHGLRSRV